MSRQTFVRWSGQAALLVAGLAVLLVACSGGTNQRPGDGTREVHGQVVLPAGHRFDLSSMRVTSPYGTAQVGADGGFTATVDAEGIMELGAETAAGELVLLGTSQGGDVRLSVDSTARALLYYAIGGMWLPAEHQDKARELLADVGEADTVTAELERLLAAGGNGLMDPDEPLLAAIEAAGQELLQTSGVAALGLARSDYSPLADGDSNIIIHDGAVERSGAQVLHDPNGSGIVVQNAYRRPAALLIYEVASDDADGTTSPVDPPTLAGTIDVPATGKLELLNSLIDVVTGGAPFAPVLSPSAELYGVPGAAKTYYELVLIGPSSSGYDRAIVSDPRFSGEHDKWDDVYFEKSLDLFLDEMLMPIIETFTLGRAASFDAAQLSAFRERTRIIYRTHLSEIGLYLSRGEVGYANAIKAAFFEIANNPILRTDMLEAATEALAVAERNKVNVQAMERRLASRASASAITAAVQGLMLSGDMTGILNDVIAADWAVSWQAEAAPVLFVLVPSEVELPRAGSGQAFFRVEPRGDVEGNFLYRWSTAGEHGTISDYLQDGLAFDTASNEVFYTHNTPLHMVAGQTDTVTVEVFAVQEGATTIPADAESIYRATATLTVVEDEFCQGKEPWCDEYYCWCMP